MAQSPINPKFSVIIAAYNGSSTLTSAIDSVLSQVYAAYEIIIIDDGSTDNTLAVVSEYGDKVRYHFQQNSGVSSARNKGAKLAQGDWLAFLDADDWYYPQRLQWHAELLQRSPSLDFLIGDYDYRGPDGGIIRRSIESNEFGMRILGTADEHDSVLLNIEQMGLLIPSYFGHTLTFSVPRKKFLALNGYAECYSIGEDLHLLIRLCAASYKAGVICQPMGAYYVHDSGLIRSIGIKAQFNTVETLSSLKQELSNAPFPIRNGFLIALRNARFDLATVLLKKGQYWQAIVSFLPSVSENFSWTSIRALLSIIKG
ncbi:MAG: glycosyltransferase [Methylobacter sp.]|nr:glycosyltransferase [Methylobacter sp.]